MPLGTHLTFPGSCEAAFRFYERVLDGKIERMQTYGESPGAEGLAPEWRAKILHASIMIRGHEVLGADLRPEDHRQLQGFFLLLNVAGAADAERAFGALADGGVVHMPLQKTFWSPAFGVVVDAFGVPWEVNAG